MSNVLLAKMTFDWGAVVAAAITVLGMFFAAWFGLRQYKTIYHANKIVFEHKYKIIQDLSRSSFLIKSYFDLFLEALVDKNLNGVREYGAEMSKAYNDFRDITHQNIPFITDVIRIECNKVVVSGGNLIGPFYNYAKVGGIDLEKIAVEELQNNFETSLVNFMNELKKYNNEIIRGGNE